MNKEKDLVQHPLASIQDLGCLPSTGDTNEFSPNSVVLGLDPGTLSSIARTEIEEIPAFAGMTALGKVKVHRGCGNPTL